MLLAVARSAGTAAWRFCDHQAIPANAASATIPAATPAAQGGRVDEDAGAGAAVLLAGAGGAPI